MRIIDSNPVTSSSVDSLTNKAVGKASDALLLSQEKVLTAGESWKGKQIKLMGKAGVQQERAGEYSQKLAADNKRAKEAVYTALKEKYPLAADYAAALKENNKVNGYHGLDEVSGILQMSSDVKTEDSAILTCGEVRSLFATAERIHQERKEKIEGLLEKAEERRQNPTPADKKSYEALLEKTQKELVARNLDNAPHPSPDPVTMRPARLTYNLNREPFVDKQPKTPIFSAEERTGKQADKPIGSEVRLYSGTHAQEQYNVPPRLLNHKRALAFMENHGNITKLARELGIDTDKLKPERIQFMTAKLLTVAHTQALSSPLVQQEMTRGEIREAAKSILQESVQHDLNWSRLNAGRLEAAAKLTGGIRSDVRELVHANMQQHKSLLDVDMMSVFAAEENITLSKAQEKTALAKTKEAVEHIVSSELRSMTSEQVTDVAKEIIHNLFSISD